LNELNGQLVRPDLDARNEGRDETPIVHGGRSFDVIADRADDQCLLSQLQGLGKLIQSTQLLLGEASRRDNNGT
jgi:hypothetical protein